MIRSPFTAPTSRRAGPLLALAAALLATPVLAAVLMQNVSDEPVAEHSSFAASSAHGRATDQAVALAASDDAVAASDAADTDPELVSHGDGVTLGRPMPNPFTGTMRYTYSIQGPPASVDIAVFDVAGRRVRILAHGTQTTGEYEATWDGLGDDGSYVRYGTYFLRARVGDERHVSRVMYQHE
jgi:flagellar hook capping protein FlgD